MPRRKKKHHARRVIRPVKAHRNKILNRDLDAAYNNFCGSKLSTILQLLDDLSEESPLAQAYSLALKTEILNRRAKKNKGDMRIRLYQQKVESLNKLISCCQQYHYRIERTPYKGQGGPSDIVYCYLPGCEQISWHCSIGKLPLPTAKDQWDTKKFSTLRKLEAGLMEKFFNYETA